DVTGKRKRRASGLRLRHDADVGLGGFPSIGVFLLGGLVVDRRGDNHILALLPVHRRRYRVLGGELQAVDGAQDLVEVAAGRGRVLDLELYLLVRPDDEYRLYGQRVVGIGVDHVVFARHFALGIGDQREVEPGALGLLDVLGPAFVVLELIHRQ